MSTFGSVLRQWRREAGITQRELAAACGIDHTYLSKLENDAPHYDAGHATIREMGEALGRSPDALYFHAGKVPGDVLALLLAEPP